MYSTYQKGALNLVWVAIVSAMMAGVAMATLYSWRYDRNVFAKGLKKASGAFQQTQRVAEQATGTGSAAAIYQCKVDGKILYSNVACDTKTGDAKKVDVQDTRGFEAPKVPVVVPTAENAPPSLNDKMIEKAIQQAR